MKKLKKFLFVVMGVMFPLICNADIEKEVNYRWYTIVEDNIRYESNVEDVCEYYDKNDFKYSDWIFSFVKPSQNDDRIIREEVEEVHIRRDNFNILQMNNFENGISDFPILEMNLYDLDNNLLDYELNNYFAGGDINNLWDNDLNTSVMVNPHSNFTYYFDDLIDVRNFKIVVKYSDIDELKNFRTIGFSTALNESLYVNSFSFDNEIVDTKCSDGVCVKEITIKENFSNDDMVFKGKVYKYQDKLFKCYDVKKLYVPGYYSNLEGFIKDESDFIEIVKEVKIETIIKNEGDSNVNDVANDDFINSEDDNLSNNDTIVDNKVIEGVIDKPIAMVTKNNSNNRKSIFPYVLMLVVLFMVSVLAFFVRKVVISRTK